MNEKIKTNEYIRTANGNIFQVKRTGDKKVYTKETTEDGRMYGVFKECITKHSPNILKVLGNGDLVNGKYIVADIHSYGFYYFEDGGVSQNQIYVGDIKTVITKEQMEKIMYRVEE